MSPADNDAPTLDHVQIAAPSGCEAAARRFYGELLGLAEIPKPPELAGRGGVWFSLAGTDHVDGVSARYEPKHHQRRPEGR